MYMYGYKWESRLSVYVWPSEFAAEYNKATAIEKTKQKTNQQNATCAS